jgi:4-alpha-glucanotransferase
VDASAAPLELARYCGVEPEYEDSSGGRRIASSEVLSAIIEALGAPASDPAASLSEVVRQRSSELVEPVVVAWDGDGSLVLRLPASAASVPAQLEVTSEQGTVVQAEIDLADAPVVERAEIAGTTFDARRVPLPPALATGHHTVRVTVREGGQQREATAVLMVAPRHIFELRPPVRRFGVFAPVYSLHSAQTLSAGDLGDLRRLIEWTGAQGGHAVATLPLLAAFLDEPREISPYLPVSRLAWNELYIELLAIPE